MKDVLCPSCLQALPITLNALNTCSFCNSSFYVYRDGQVIEIDNSNPTAQSGSTRPNATLAVNALPSALKTRLIDTKPDRVVFILLPLLFLVFWP